MAIDNAPQPPDNGALACDRVAWPNHHDCHDFATCVAGLIDCCNSGGGLIALAGHGLQGLQGCGGGQTPDYMTQIISNFNESLWTGPFSQLQGKNFTLLTLFGCDVGGDQDGAQLLYDMCKLIGKPVRARTGEVGCGGNGQISFEPNSTWQVADPSMTAPPAPIPSPKHLTITRDAQLLFVAPHVQRVPIDSVTRVELSARPSGSSTRSKTPLVQFEGASSAFSVLQYVNLAVPFKSGRLTAIPTGALEMTYTVGRSEVHKTFVINNDRALQDTAAPEYTYFGTPELASRLAQMRRIAR